MPGSVQGSHVDDHDPAITEALEQFCSAPEQTYEQFLSTFTYLTPENVKDPRLTDPRRHSPHSEIDSREEQREDGVSAIEENTLHSRHSVTADLEEVVLDAGCVGGRLGGVGRPNPDRPVKFDNYLEDSEDEEETSHATGALSSEVREAITASSSSQCHHMLLEMSSTFTEQKTQTENQNERLSI